MRIRKQPYSKDVSRWDIEQFCLFAECSCFILQPRINANPDVAHVWPRNKSINTSKGPMRIILQRVLSKGV